MAGRQLNPLRLPVGYGRGKMYLRPKDSNTPVGIRDRAAEKAPEW